MNICSKEGNSFVLEIVINYLLVNLLDTIIPNYTSSQNYVKFSNKNFYFQCVDLILIIIIMQY